MKRASFCKLIALLFIFSLSLTACKKSPKNITPVQGRMGSPVGTGSRPAGPATPERSGRLPGTEETQQTRLPTDDGQTPLPGERWDPSNFNEDRSQFSQQTVYFDFDKSTIKASEQGKLQAVAEYLRAEPRTMLLVEGHCDERGTAEYNRALGERRALAAREYLISLGIIGERMNTISYGEDRPADPGHDEVAWGRNRRAEFVLMRPKG
jgi:peptidoglycan-associated lipoprotein